MNTLEENKWQDDLELLPDPERTISGLRDTGYDFNTAVADIVDNSIAADAANVKVSVTMDREMRIHVMVGDDGYGMSPEGLQNAMKYGSKAREDKSSLGKFGLGLKTASTAFCRRLIVISRAKGSDLVEKAQWDLDYIAQKNKWLLQRPPITDDEYDCFEEYTGGGAGTLVIWDKVDRLQQKEYKSPKAAQTNLDKKIEELRFHLSMVFQRFLDFDDSRARNVKIELNTTPLIPWDPFCTKEPNAQMLQESNIPVDIQGEHVGSFHVAAYVIPRKEEFSTPEAAKIARGSNDYQGFYIYRENRLIHSGNWLGFFAKEPHLSLLRVDFSFSHELDELLSVDIKKSRILLIGELSEWLTNFLAAPRREAQNIYRRGETNKINKNGAGAHAPSNTNINEKAAEVESSKITPTGENEAKVENQNGSFTKTISISNSTDPKQNRVIPVPSIEGGALWEPALVDGQHAVKINQSHPYYKKVYGPVLSKSVIVEGMDALLWSLAEAENSTCNDKTLENYEDMRYMVSKILKRLVADLPEPELSDEDE